MADAITKNVGKVWWTAANRPWELHCEPFKLAPHMYYIGNTWVGCFLIDTGDGLLLIDTAIFECTYDVLQNIYTLGYNPKDIKNILLTHCHVDHIGGVPQFKSISGANVWISKEDMEFYHHPANQNAADGGIFKLMPLEADCFYDDSKEMVFGNVKIRTRLSPGHTPGTTSFFIDLTDDDGKVYTVGIHGGVGTNTMADKYFQDWNLDPTLRQQFIDGCAEMKKIHVDITVPSHPAHGDLMARRGEDPMDFHPLVDENEWPRFLQIRKEFAEQLNV